MEYVITAGIIAAVVILILICILSTWRKVPADKAAIVTDWAKQRSSPAAASSLFRCCSASTM